MADNFNLTGFLKKNQLLNENIGGYRDIQPVKEISEIDFDDDDDDDDEDDLPTFKDVKWWLDAAKFTPKEVADSEALEDYLYNYYEEYAPEFVGMDTSKHDKMLVKQYQDYYKKKKKGKVREEMGTAMEDVKGWSGLLPDEERDERIMGLGGDRLLAAAQDLLNDGFELEDLIDFLHSKLS